MKIRSSFATYAGLSVLSILVTGCFEPIEFTAPDSLLNTSTTPTWHGPSTVDLEDVRDSAAADFFMTYSDSASLRDQASVSYGSFDVAASASEGALVASFYDGTHLRPFGRAYSPYGLGGTGWATLGTRASYLDTASTNDALFVSLGFSPSGVGFALFSDGASTAYTGNIQLKSGGAWSEIAAQVGASLDALTAPGQGYLRSPATEYAANGSSISTAWDSTGHAYYGFVDESSVRTIGYVSTYTAFTSWTSGNGFRLGPLTSQVQLHNDGFGVVPVWMGQDSLIATSVKFGGTIAGGQACALTPAGLKCWGLDDFGQTGNDSSGIVAYPLVVDGIGSTVISVATGTSHTCAATQGGSALCWGRDDVGQMGTGVVGTEQTSPMGVTGVTGLAREVAAGIGHTCARTAAGAVYCWGLNTSGQVGDNTGVGPKVPKLASGSLATKTVTQITAGSSHSCALTDEDVVSCWGENSDMQTTGTVAADVQLPAAVVGVPASSQIAAGTNHTCALTNAGTVYCWGDNTSGQIGNNGTGVDAAPVQVAGLLAGLTITQIAAGGDNTCALASTGAVYCWGDNSEEQLADGTTLDQAVPVLIPLPSGLTITSLSVGPATIAAATAQGQVLCWGDNTTNQCHGDTAISAAGVPLEIAASDDQAIRASSSTALFTEVSTLSTGDVKSMSAATDGQGNVVVVFLQTDPAFVAAPTGTISTAYTIRGNDVRVYAAMRGASGIWTGPTRIDDAARFSSDTTTVFQDAWGRASASQSNITGGIEYPTPVVAYLGDGRFLAAFAMTDLAGSTSSIYTRGYSVGSGWDPSSQIGVLDSLKLNASTTIEAYRFANDLFMTGNGQGGALLVAHVVVPSDDGSDVTLHNFGMKSYIYSRDQGGWQDQYSQLIPSSICRALADFPALGDPYLCWGLKPKGMIFPDGEAVIVFPAPAGSTGTSAAKLRLYSTELHQ